MVEAVNWGFIKSTDHRPTDHQPTDHRTLTHRPTDPIITNPTTKQNKSTAWKMKNYISFYLIFEEDKVKVFITLR